MVRRYLGSMNLGTQSQRRGIKRVIRTGKPGKGNERSVEMSGVGDEREKNSPRAFKTIRVGLTVERGQLHCHLSGRE